MTSDRLNRRDLIIDTASQFFMEQGYSATSVRQIADEVGVTEAALYYHFKGGKRELLEAVFECQMPDFTALLDNCQDVNSLPELIECFVGQAEDIGRLAMQKFRWIVAEFPHLSDDERALFHKKHVALQDSFTRGVAQFVDDPRQARKIAMTIICTMIGYGQLFWTMEMESIVEFSADEVIEMLKGFAVNQQKSQDISQPESTDS